MTDIPDEAVEPALRAWFEYERTAHPASTLGDRMRAVLTAAAPYIAAQAVGSDHWAHAAIAAQDAALTAQINEAVKWGREKQASELADLRAGIEALRDEWRAGLCACLTCAETRRHADALEALLGGAE